MAMFGIGGGGGLDANKTAKKQFNWNKKAAIFQAGLNATNQKTPYGTSTFKPTRDKKGRQTGFKQVIKPTQTQKGLIKQEEALAGSGLALQQNQTKQIADMTAQPFSLSGMPNVAPVDFGNAPAMPTFDTSGVSAMPVADDATRQRVEDSMYQRASSRLDPQWGKQQTDLETQLANAGHARGSAGYTQAMEDFGRQRTDAYSAARNEAVGMGGAEQSRLFGMGMQGREQGFNEATARYGLGLGARQQGVSEELSRFGTGMQGRQQTMAELIAQRNQPFNELAAIRGGGGGSTMPQYNSPPQTGVGTTDYSGLETAANQQQQQNNQGFMGSLFGLAGKALPFALASDVRLKADIKRVGTLDNGLPVYTYRYKGSPVFHMGVMAQEVMDVNPEAVAVMNGYLAVDYAQVA